MADNSAGDGLAQLEMCSKELTRAPEKLDGGQPTSTLEPSENSQLRQCANPKAQESDALSQKLRPDERFFTILTDRAASYPRHQYQFQQQEEREAMEQQVLNGTLKPLPRVNLVALASHNVKQRWIDQGIWNYKWNSMADGRWKHEEPPVSEPQWKKDLKLKPIKGYDRDASRPFQQFEYQVSRAKKQIEHELKVGDDHIGAPADIGTRAYERVKNLWLKQKIWDDAWGVLPGNLWKHERPLEDFLDDDLMNWVNKKPLYHIYLRKETSKLSIPPHHRAPIRCTAQKKASTDVSPHEGEDCATNHTASSDRRLMFPVKERHVRFALPSVSETTSTGPPMILVHSPPQSPQKTSHPGAREPSPERVSKVLCESAAISSPSSPANEI
ncbi:hypothetical protein F5Y05DRAFT_393882 [Hypoxylon sp. FL0543]|nr:hypothetical protein F5Y05DRAFT_393882 [Hypoxylon sp. FL0543]